jgi:lysozyme
MSSDTGERRLLPVYLFVSALVFVGLAFDEGFSGKATIPVKGDKPTYGLGSTMRPDGKPVQIGDQIKVTDALRLSVNQLAAKENALRRCVTAPMAQFEWDALVSLAYNVGEGAVCKSRLVAKINAEDYAGACDEYLRWRYYQDKDCSLPENRSLCGGLWKRRQGEAARCRGETP